MSNSFVEFKDDEECLRLIKENRDSDPVQLSIKLSSIEAEKRNFIVSQVSGRQKAKHKFPFLLKTDSILFPSKISLEQSSSEKSAAFKATLVKGKNALDLTAGFGIDAHFFSKSFNCVILVEQDLDLLDVVKHNFFILNAKNVQFIASDAITALNSLSEEFDLIYLDPSRRLQSKKVFRIEDCSPDISALLPILKSRCKEVMIKLSPMLDITEITRKLTGVSDIYVISIDNECKEILVRLNKNDFSGKIHCIELGSHPFTYKFSIEVEKSYSASSSAMLNYLYLPNASVAKSGAFNSLVKDFGVNKISPNSHIYTSDTWVENFPGSGFKVIELSNYKKRISKKKEEYRGFNIIKRNFPDEVKTIASKLKIKDSGKYYLIAYRNSENKPEICIAEKINV